MERLTHIDSKGWYIEDISMSYDERHRGKEIDRLAAYEDIGLEPEEIMNSIGFMSPVCVQCDGKTHEGVRTEKCGYAHGDMTKCMEQSIHLGELAKAEEDGRLVVLPCKVVYVPTWDAGEKCDLVCPVSMDGKGCCDFCDKAEMFIYERPCRQEHIEQIGKTVFLTREEAEEAVFKMPQ